MADYPVWVCPHARKRVRQRVGITGRSAERAAQKAWDTGKGPEDFSGATCNYLRWLIAGNVEVVRVYANNIWLFNSNKSLVTVLQPRPEFRKVLCS